MIWPNTVEEIYLYTIPIDIRQGINKLKRYVRILPRPNLPRGVVYVFVDRKNVNAKVLFRDAHGTWLCTKKLSGKNYLNLRKYRPIYGGFAELSLDEVRRFLLIGPWP